MEHFPSVLWHLRDERLLQCVGVVWKRCDETAHLSWLAFGNLFSIVGDHKSSIRCFNKASTLRKTWAFPHVLAGYEFLSIDDFQEANNAFICALQKDPLTDKAR